ncbi:MAG TPA: penicillin-binding protein 2 [Thermoanaerobaculia bacterium]|nr:penicillin-binding protein 2 [Thermoanaerobaculia bacterium]
MKAREQRGYLVGRVRGLGIACAVLMTVLLVTYWYVQGAEGEIYRDMADHNRLRKVPIEATRGLIYDRKGDLLVENVPSYSLLLDRSRDRSLAASVEFAARVLDTTTSALDAVLARDHDKPDFVPVLLAEGLTLGQVARISAQALEHPEFEIHVDQLRLYRHGPQTAHLLGYLGEVSEGELRSSHGELRAGELVGRKGVEEEFDSELRGRDGVRVVEVDSRGRPRKEFGRLPATPGRSLRLTIDLELQQEAERLLTGKAGAIVALDPNSGAVLALASAPSFNPNVFARRLDQSQWESILKDPGHPLEDRAIQDAYSPGSVFKIVVAVAGLAEGVIRPQDTIHCSGSKVFYDRRFRCWWPSGHGWVNLHKALRESCDIYFYTLGQKLGIENIAKYARLLGLGKKTGIGLPTERPGLVPDENWSEMVRHHPWYPGETISVAIGQGPLLVTPLQLAVMMAAVANGGYRVTPYVVLDGPPPPPVPLHLPASVLAPVQSGLVAVVNENGTGVRAAIPGLEVAGKTGTAQVVAQKTRTLNKDLPEDLRDHAWFVSYAPAEHPRLVIVVFVEHGGHGADAAAPIAKDLYETYFKIDKRKLPAT